MNPPVPGIRVGHWTDPIGLTGCTVVLCPPGTIGSGEVRGGAPGTRETDLLRPGTLVKEINAVLLTGGSAFGHKPQRTPEMTGLAGEIVFWRWIHHSIASIATWSRTHSRRARSIG